MLAQLPLNTIKDRACAIRCLFVKLHMLTDSYYHSRPAQPARLVARPYTIHH